MAKQDDSNGSGNDGSWFLEAVGAAPPAPTPSETVTALEMDNTIPDLASVTPGTDDGVALTSFDGGTGTSTSTFERPREPVPAVIDDTGEMDVLPPLTASGSKEDADLSPVLRSRRSFRWPALAFGVFLVVIAALAAMWLPAALRQDAVVVKQSYADASLTLRQQLPPASPPWIRSPIPPQHRRRSQQRFPSSRSSTVHPMSSQSWHPSHSRVSSRCSPWLRSLLLIHSVTQHRSTEPRDRTSREGSGMPTCTARPSHGCS